jgi:hypothetical protein
MSNIIVKKSKPSVKVKSKASVREEDTAVKEETIAAVVDGGKIDFFYLMNGAGVLIGIIYIIFGILHYVLRIL